MMQSILRRHDGRSFVVTGGANGIGAAVVERLASEGAHVIICDIADAGAQVARLGSAGLRVDWTPCDLADPVSVSAYADDLAVLGCEPDGLVHSAGIYPSNPVGSISYDEWRRVFAINIDAFFLLTKLLLPTMQRKGWGRIVGITSNSFLSGPPEVSHYVASKGAMIGFIRSLSREVGPSGITVNGVAPTITRTATIEDLGRAHLLEPLAQRQAVPRVAVPEDYTGMLSYLLSHEADMVTGQNIAVDGGWTHS